MSTVHRDFKGIAACCGGQSRSFRAPLGAREIMYVKLGGLSKMPLKTRSGEVGVGTYSDVSNAQASSLACTSVHEAVQQRGCLTKPGKMEVGSSSSQPIGPSWVGFTMPPKSETGCTSVEVESTPRKGWASDIGTGAFVPIRGSLRIYHTCIG